MLQRWHSHAETPGLVHLAIGFSLSGNALLLMAAERRAPWLAGLIAVSPPVDLEHASHAIHRGLSRLYELRFLLRLRRAIAEREHDGLAQRVYRIPLHASLRLFDAVYTAPEGGFASNTDYYNRCSAGPRLDEIDLPGVILTAADDPFLDSAVYRGFTLSRHLLLHVEPHGGHVAFLERRGPGAGHWLDSALVHYASALVACSRDSSLRTRF